MKQLDFVFRLDTRWRGKRRDEIKPAPEAGCLIVWLLHQRRDPLLHQPFLPVPVVLELSSHREAAEGHKNQQRAEAEAEPVAAALVLCRGCCLLRWSGRFRHDEFRLMPPDTS